MIFCDSSKMCVNKIDVLLWLRGQLRVVKFGFGYASRSDFTNPKWKCFPKVLLVIFRSICALYSVGFAVATGLESEAPLLSHLPFLTQVLGAVYFFVSAVSTEVSFFRKIRRFSTHRETFLPSKKRTLQKSPTLETISDAEQGTPFDSETDIPERLIETSCQPVFKDIVACEAAKMMNLFWYHKLQWIAYNISLTLSITFTIFALIYEPKAIFVGKEKGRLLRLHTYGFTSLFLVIDLFINAIPIRILHLAYPLALSAVYFIISVTCTKAYGQTVKLFPEMRCEGDSCLEQMALVLGLGSPLVHITLCALHCAKNQILLCISKRLYKQTKQATPGSRKVSRASRASDSTAMTVLEGYKTYAKKVQV